MQALRARGANTAGAAAAAAARSTAPAAAAARLSAQPLLSRPSSARWLNSARSFDPNPRSDAARIGEVVLTTKHGESVLLDPLLNKGTGFLLEERERLGIRGMVPPRHPHDHPAALQQGVNRIMHRYWNIPRNIEKYSYLIALQDRNEVLFYRCLLDNIDKLAPIIYTPTVGEACQGFSTLFRRPRGMYFSYADRGSMHSMVWNWPSDDVEIIVVTDGSRILGLGDLGTNGMGIPIGKLSLYTAAAGIHPSKCLPVVIDVGTNNEALLKDPFYLGLQHKRVTGDAYLQTVDEFIRAIRERYPRALIQFEDFSNENAARLLEYYRHRVLCFNDDIQGTGTVALAGVLGALRAAGHTDPDALSKQRIVIAGAGTAGLGVANALKMGMVAQGLTEEDARSRIYLLDGQGLLGHTRSNTDVNQRPWVKHDQPDGTSLETLMETVKPSILLGLTGFPGVFTETAIRRMARYHKRPIVFPLSNPTSRAEATAEDIYKWTDGQAIFASGSPFDPVMCKDVLRYPSQANNFYCFPGIGLGALVCQAKWISDSMLYVGARALAAAVKEEDIAMGRVFPPVREIRRVTEEIALAICKQAHVEGIAQAPKPTSDEALREKIRERMWEPKYPSMVRVENIPR